jgi:hypothetical protein
MDDRRTTVAKKFARKLASLDWSMCNNQFSLAGLHGVVSLVCNATKKNLLAELASVQACNPQSQPQPQLLKDRFSLEIDVFMTFNTRGPRRVSVAALEKFYQAFCKTSVTPKEMNDFLHKNILLVIIWCVYSWAKKHVAQVVAALTFSRPRKDQAMYLAYIAVSDGRKHFPSFTDSKIVEQPTEGILFDTKSKGYQGFGLGRLLLSMLDRIMCSQPFRKVTNSSYCFLHYNVNNTGSEELWKTLGFSNLSLAQDKQNKSAYQTLVRGLMRCPIFEASNSDSDNCQAVYRLSSTAANDDNAKMSDKEKATE